MKNKIEIRKPLLLLFSIFLYSCSSETIQTLSNTSNKFEMGKVLAYYRFIDNDDDKYNAALFLIENARYHYSKGKVKTLNPEIEKLRHETDSIYFSITKDISLKNYPWKLLTQALKKRQKGFKEMVMPEGECSNTLYLDSEDLSFSFFTEHIDHAFGIWKKSRFANFLTFDEFKEYILPYRSVRGYGFHETGKYYEELFGKHVLADTAASLKDHVFRYNLAVKVMRNINGKTKRKNKAGIFDLYTHDFHDCVDRASYGANILRACGIPTVVEYNVCYRNFGGRHFHCNTFDSTRVWTTFNPESSLPGSGDWAFAVTLNVYREMFGAQKNTPYFLRNKDEYIPTILNSPCIMDVTSNLQKTVEIDIPFTKQTNNRLAYLATFHKASGGLIPVTWGVIDSLAKSIHFDFAIPNMIYFPIYYEDKDIKTFGQPFYVTSEGDKVSILPIPGVDTKMDSVVNLVVNRKFPRKTNMIELSEKLVGGRFLGSNRLDFKNAQVLYEIKEPPMPYFLNYPLTKKGKFQYYRFQASDKYPHANISMLEWVTDKKYNYTNVMNVSRSHITTPEAIIRSMSDSLLVKLLDAKSWDDMKHKTEYDGNMQTAPGAYPSISMFLSKPQIVTSVRFAPKNADNGITANDEFELYYWDNGWTYGGYSKAKYEYVEFKNIPANKLYWLVNKSQGNEELLFTIINGKQLFLYSDLIN